MASHGEGVRRWLGRLMPYVIAASAMGFIAWRYRIEDILAEMGKGDFWPLLPIAFAAAIGSLLLVSIGDTIVVRACGGELGYLDMVRAKAGSSLLDIVHYALGHGAYAVWFARFSGLGAGRAGGALLYIMAGDLLAVCSIGAVAMWGAGVGLDGAAGWAIPLVAGVLWVLLLVGPSKAMRDLPDVPLFEPWGLVERPKAVAHIASRVAQHAAIWIPGTWLASQAFGLEIPFGAMAAHMPLIMLMSALPVNVAGIGAVQLVWVALFSDYAQPEAILAFQVLWNLAIVLSATLRGLPFIRRLVREVEVARAEAASEAP